VNISKRFSVLKFQAKRYSETSLISSEVHGDISQETVKCYW